MLKQPSAIADLSEANIRSMLTSIHVELKNKKTVGEQKPIIQSPINQSPKTKTTKTIQLE